MSDYTRLTQLIEGLHQQVSDIADEVARITGGAGESGGGRSLRAATGDAAAPPQAPAGAGELPIFLPTPQDDPEEIIGGRRTEDFPDCCALGDDTDYYCTGTLVAPNIVVTAAHCPALTRAFLKGSDVTRPASGETIRIKEQFAHPSEDFRVLVLERDSTVTPRHVAQGPEVRGTEALVVGFGTVNLAGTVGYGIKRMVKVPITSLGCESREDQKQYGCRGGTEMVAGHRGLRRDTCKGDSGGPLYIESTDGDYYLLGATSRGMRNSSTTCGDGGIYVRVDKLLDWVEEKTGVRVEGSLI